MNAFVSVIRRGWHPRPLAMTIAIVSVALAVFVLFAIAPNAVSAQGPTSCFEQMEAGAVPQAIEFLSSTYTVTVSTDACVESGIDLLIGFVDDTPFAVDGNGASASGSDFLYPLGPVSGTMGYEVTAASPVELVLTDVNATGGSIMVWLGSLKSTPAASATPAPIASATSLIVVGPGPLKKGPAPKWEFSPLKGDMSLKISAGVIFTATTNNQIWPAEVCGTDCFEVAVSTSDGMIEAKALAGWWWTATLVGPADARVLMPAPAQTASPSPAQSDDQKTGGGAATGAAPSVWASSPAPASAPRPIWLPLRLRPSR